MTLEKLLQSEKNNSLPIWGESYNNSHKINNERYLRQTGFKTLTYLLAIQLALTNLTPLTRRVKAEDYDDDADLHYSWTEAQGPVNGYDVQVSLNNGEFIDAGTSSGTTFIYHIENPTHGDAYRLRTRAKDSEGNPGEWSDPSDKTNLWYNPEVISLGQSGLFYISLPLIPSASNTVTAYNLLDAHPEINGIAQLKAIPIEPEILKTYDIEQLFTEVMANTIVNNANYVVKFDLGGGLIIWYGQDFSLEPYGATLIQTGKPIELKFNGVPDATPNKTIDLISGANFIGLPISPKRIQYDADSLLRDTKYNELMAIVGFDPSTQWIKLLFDDGNNNIGGVNFPLTSGAGYLVVSSGNVSLPVSNNAEGVSASPQRENNNTGKIINYGGPKASRIGNNLFIGGKLVNMDDSVLPQKEISIDILDGKNASAIKGRYSAKTNGEGVWAWPVNAEIGDIVRASETGREDVKYVQFVIPELGKNAYLGKATHTPLTNNVKQNFPNPFNPDTWIPYTLKSPADVLLEIYDSAGHLVRNINIGHQNAGVYTNKEKSAHWDGRNNYGERVSSGTYFYTLRAGEFTKTGKMVLEK